MTHVFSRAPTRDLPTAVSAEGAWITDADGAAYLDGAGGALVVERPREPDDGDAAQGATSTE